MLCPRAIDRGACERLLVRLTTASRTRWLPVALGDRGDVALPLTVKVIVEVDGSDERVAVKTDLWTRNVVDHAVEPP